MARKIPDDDPKKRAAKDFDRRMRHQAMLMWTARVLMTLGLLIAGQHLLAHAGYRPVHVSMAEQDLLIGYPTAGLVLLAGVLIWGRNPLKK